MKSVMDRTNVYIIFLLLFSFGSCKNDRTNAGGVAEANSFAEQNCEQDTTCDSSKNVKAQVINVYRLKKSCTPFSTSTYLSVKDTKIYYRPNNDGYYGMYHLFKDRDGNVELMGEMVIFNDEKPWMFENETDEFIEIITSHAEVLIFDTIGVGANVKTLTTAFGTPVDSVGEIKIFKSRNCFITAKIEDGIIVILKAGFYNEELTEQEITVYLKNRPFGFVGQLNKKAQKMVISPL